MTGDTDSVYIYSTTVVPAPEVRATRNSLSKIFLASKYFAPTRYTYGKYSVFFSHNLLTLSKIVGSSLMNTMNLFIFASFIGPIYYATLLLKYYTNYTSFRYTVHATEQGKQSTSVAKHKY